MGHVYKEEDGILDDDLYQIYFRGYKTEQFKN